MGERANGARDAGNAADSAALAERKRFTRLGTDEERLLAGLAELMAREAPSVVEQFYDHLMRFPSMRALLGDKPMVDRLKGFQREYLERLASGRYDEAYAADRVRIGRRHEAIGLAPQWYVGTYALYVDQLLPRIHRALAGEPEKALHSGMAMVKLLLLDMQLVLDAYYEVRERRAVERSEQLAAVGELAASIAHEVRNPLAGMRGAMEVLRKQPGRPDAAEVIEEMIGQIDRLEHLVRDLLVFARPVSPRPRAFDLPDLLDRVLRYHEEAAAAAGITIERRYGGDAAPLAADPQQLEQVVLNLVTNAVQAMERGGRLTLGVVRNPEGLCIRVEDTGPGIPEAILDRVFQPFFTTKHRGSGLGLSIVRRIVENHGGRVSIDSQPGRGTAVSVTLPAAAGD